jgi:benzoyl-CoA reductase/2-hydroxyglutaryl-CoA dehydratase subunit BcrC/BadD/HgdB
VPAGLTAAGWDRAFPARCALERSRFRALYGPRERRSYLYPPSHWAAGGDRRLLRLKYDPEPASLGLCALVESQTERLHARARAGAKVIAAMKDLSAVPAMLAAAPDAVCFCADLAYLQPCTSESGRFLELAAARGLGEDFCDVRAAVGALADGEYWPRPDLCVAAAGGCCDDFSACAQHVAALGFPTHFWELPEIGDGPRPGDAEFLRLELEGVRAALGRALGRELSDPEIGEGLRRVNRLRASIRSIRDLAYGRDSAPLPALESFLVEALAVDYASDAEAAAELLAQVEALCRKRVAARDDVLDPDAVRLTWVTPAMDLCLQNLMEELGARVAGTEYMFGHAFQAIDKQLPPLAALAENVLGDPMIGSAARRARLIAAEAERYAAEGVVLVSFFGASHCAWESRIIAEELRARPGLPTLIINAQSTGNAVPAAVRSRLEAFVETLRARRAGRAAVGWSGDASGSVHLSGGQAMSKSGPCGAAPSGAAQTGGIFERLRESVVEEMAFAQAAKAAGRKLVGIYCEYTPREMIHAAGALSACLCGYSQEMAQAAEEDLPNNLCPLVKSSYGYVKTGGCPFFEMADAIVAETTCDGKKKMYELIEERHPTFILELTQKPATAEAFRHWLEEVRGLKRFLEETLGARITDQSLRAAIAGMNRRREALLGLYEFTRSEAVYLTGAERLLVNQRLAGSPLEDELLAAVRAELERRRAAGRPVAGPDAPRVLVTGVPIGPDVAKVVSLIEESGGIVVVQEACTGAKPLVENVREDGDPLEAVARKYFNLPCPCFTPNPGRFELLDRLAREFRVQAVVDVIWMACHTYNVESVLVRRWAQERGLPFLKVETDYSPSDTEQLRARIEPLMEMART